MAPPRPEARSADVASTAAGAEVLLETKIDALDITVLRGGGDEVGRWALDNGFLLSPDAPEVLDFYASRSPVFMAAKFDATRAGALGQSAGQGTPIMATIPTSDPWVPLRILGLGLESSRTVQADVFLLTDTKPKLLAGGRGLSVGRSESAPAGLLDDLRSDKGMQWVPERMWFSYLQVDAPAGSLDYDLAVSTRSGSQPSIEAAGIPAPQTRAVVAPLSRSLWPIPLGLAVGGIALAVTVAARRRRRGSVVRA